MSMSIQSDVEILSVQAVEYYAQKHHLSEGDVFDLFCKHQVFEKILIQHEMLHQLDMEETFQYVDRLDAAFFYLKHSPQTKVIVSGGRGPGEDISEAEAMSGYLMKHGVPKEKIFLENRSTSTRENLRFSRKYADAEKDRVGIVTNDFHIYRSSLIARQEGYENIIMIPAGSNPVFQINYLVREFFAVVRTWMSG